LAAVKGLYERNGWFYFQPPKPKGLPRPTAVSLGTKDLVTALQEMATRRLEFSILRAVRAGTLEEVLPSYYAAKGADAKATRLARKVILDSFKDATGNPRVDAIDGKLIDAWRAVLAETGGKRGKPVSLATLKSYTVTLRAFLSWAVEKKLIRVHPLPRMERHMRVGATRVQGFLTEEDREKLLAAEAPDYVKLILLLGFLAGLRDSEMLALNPKWIWISEDGTRGTLTVQATPIVFAAKRRKPGDAIPAVAPPLRTGMWQPKNRKKRSIPLHPRLLEFLKEYGLRSPWLLAPEKVEWPGEEMNAKRFEAKKALAGVAKRAGVGRVTFHMLRHSFATHLVMKGVTLADVAGLLGDSLKVTEEHYAGYAPSKANPLEVL
jgi:integrase